MLFDMRPDMLFILLELLSTAARHAAITLRPVAQYIANLFTACYSINQPITA